MDVVKSGHMPFDDNPMETHEATIGGWRKKVLWLRHCQRKQDFLY
jgi:hypothetical protein